MVEFPFAAETAPAPTDAELQRWYDNHPDAYSSPELRRIKAIVLSPQTLAKDIPITDDDLRAAYNQRKAGLRHAGEAVGPGDLGAGRGQGAGAGASSGAAAPTGRRCRRRRSRTGRRRWRSTTPRRQEFPDADLAKAVFAAPADAVSESGEGRAGLVCDEGDQGRRRAAKRPSTT